MKQRTVKIFQLLFLPNCTQSKKVKINLGDEILCFMFETKLMHFIYFIFLWPSLETDREKAHFNSGLHCLLPVEFLQIIRLFNIEGRSERGGEGGRKRDTFSKLFFPPELKQSGRISFRPYKGARIYPACTFPLNTNLKLYSSILYIN